MAHIGLEPKSYHTNQVLSTIWASTFSHHTLHIYYLKGSLYPHLSNNYLINYLIFPESYSVRDRGSYGWVRGLSVAEVLGVLNCYYNVPCNAFLFWAHPIRVCLAMIM